MHQQHLPIVVIAQGQRIFFLWSLMSPEDHLFGGRKKGKVGRGGNQYRMEGGSGGVQSKHQILNHYIK